MKKKKKKKEGKNAFFQLITGCTVFWDPYAACTPYLKKVTQCKEMFSIIATLLAYKKFIFIFEEIWYFIQNVRSLRIGMLNWKLWFTYEFIIVLYKM
jgi:hypothetical protein